jgi:hypothetical protein
MRTSLHLTSILLSELRQVAGEDRLRYLTRRAVSASGQTQKTPQKRATSLGMISTAVTKPGQMTTGS